MFDMKPCPFCGRVGSVFIWEDEDGWFSGWCAPTDNGCGALGPARLTRKEAAEAWNNRPTND